MLCRRESRLGDQTMSTILRVRERPSRMRRMAVPTMNMLASGRRVIFCRVGPNIVVTVRQGISHF